MSKFAEIINNLVMNEEINKYFDTSSLYQAKLIAEKERSKCIKFYTKNLKTLLDEDFPLSTTKDMYKDKIFSNLIAVYEDIEKDPKSHESNFEKYVKFNLDEVIILYSLLIMYLCSEYMKIGNLGAKNLDEFYKNLKLELGGQLDLNYFWFRGVTNIKEHDLIPSMYRALNEEYVHIDGNKINNLYQLNGLHKEYFKIFGNNKIDDFYAYMQHSISYSPLLDFTKNINIAGSFATAPTNPIEYEKTMAGIFLLISDKNGNTKSKKINIEIFNKKLNLNSKIFNKPLYFCKIDDFFVKYRIIMNKSNDRMKYQNGLFMHLIKAVFVKKRLLFINSASSLFVLEIPFNSNYLNKLSICRDIKLNHEEYSYECLMNPYSWFGKRH